VRNAGAYCHAKLAAAAGCEEREKLVRSDKTKKFFQNLTAPLLLKFLVF
jgi:hypothetical protein